MNNRTRGKYKKDIKIQYRYIDSPDSEMAQNEVFDLLFDRIYKNPGSSLPPRSSSPILITNLGVGINIT